MTMKLLNYSGFLKGSVIIVAFLFMISCDGDKTVTASKMIYSTSVQDSFRIYTSLPSGDPSKSPLVILLDANAYFDPVVAEYNLGKLTQG